MEMLSWPELDFGFRCLAARMTSFSVKSGIKMELSWLGREVFFECFVCGGYFVLNFLADVHKVVVHVFCY